MAKILGKENLGFKFKTKKNNYHEFEFIIRVEREREGLTQSIQEDQKCLMDTLLFQGANKQRIFVSYLFKASKPS